MTTNVFLKPTEAAEYLRMSPSTLAKLRVYGNGPTFCRFGEKAIRYRQGDLDTYMASRSASSTAAYSRTSAKNAGRTSEKRGVR
jgi:predicted DNA-binding transcriptional regulator AlpA